MVSYETDFQGDMTAEEIFNMFFGGGMPGSSVYVRRGGRWHRQAGNMQEQQQVRIPTALSQVEMD